MVDFFEEIFPRIPSVFAQKSVELQLDSCINNSKWLARYKSLLSCERLNGGLHISTKRHTTGYLTFNYIYVKKSCIYEHCCSCQYILSQSSATKVAVYTSKWPNELQEPFKNASKSQMSSYIRTDYKYMYLCCIGDSHTIAPGP